MFARSRNSVRRLRGKPAVVAPGVLSDLVGNCLVALALHDVERRLRDDVLRERADEDRIAEVVPHARDFLEDLGQADVRSASSSSCERRFEIIPPGTWCSYSAGPYVAIFPRGLPSRSLTQAK